MKPEDNFISQLVSTKIHLIFQFRNVIAPWTWFCFHFGPFVMKGFSPSNIPDRKNVSRPFLSVLRPFITPRNGHETVRNVRTETQSRFGTNSGKLSRYVHVFKIERSTVLKSLNLSIEILKKFPMSLQINYILQAQFIYARDFLLW